MRHRRTWCLPVEPTTCRVADRLGVVWTRDQEGPPFAYLWRAPNFFGLTWGELLTKRGPLKEVM